MGNDMTPNHMNRLPMFISLQHQDRRSLGIIWIILYQDGTFQSTHYFASSQIIVRKFVVSMLRDTNITR